MANPYLEWLDNNQQTQRMEIVDRISIGRTCKGIDPQKRILLQFPLISRDHAEINFTAGQLRITDTSRKQVFTGTIVTGDHVSKPSLSNRLNRKRRGLTEHSVPSVQNDKTVFWTLKKSYRRFRRATILKYEITLWADLQWK